MLKIFLIMTLLLTCFSATALAAKSEIYEYTSKAFGYKIICPVKPLVKVDAKNKRELLVFASRNGEVTFGYQVNFDAFDNKTTPDFNKASEKTLNEYLDKFRAENIYEYVGINQITKDIKGVMLINAKEIEVKGDDGEVEGVLTANEQRVFTFFRTKSGRCVSVELVVDDLDEEDIMDFRKSLATFKDK